MMDREELFGALIDLDVDIAAVLNDPEGKTEVMEALRKYEKVIMKICGLEERVAKFFGLPADTVKASIARAYNEWKSEEIETNSN